MSQSIASLSLVPTHSDSAADRTSATSISSRVVAFLPDLRRRALFLTRSPDRADDLVQDTLERALRYADSFRPGSQLRAWLMKIMQNLFVSHCRRGKVEQRTLKAVLVDPNAWPGEQKNEQILGLFPPVKRALAQLPPHLREVIHLVDLQQRSYQDAATEQQVPVGTIMSRLHRGRARLKLILSEQQSATEMSTGPSRAA
jgi:RNA polymerase sigma-70 factor (ECF subfamily)